MQALAEQTGTRLRPHAKSHKCLPVAGLQIEAGAPGICVAKVSEATTFALGGVHDILAVYPLIGKKAEVWAAMAARYPEGRFEVTADSETGLDDLGRAASRNGVTLGVWIKVDVGLHRCGLEPDDPALRVLVLRAGNTPGLRIRGIVTHAGHVYGASREDAVRIGRHEGEIMVSTARELERAGSGPLQVGLGSTPTVFHAARVDGVDEIHPGVYVFGDRQQVRLGAMTLDDVALTVLGTVVSRPTSGRWILDAGTKTLSGDRGAHGSTGPEGYGSVRSVGDHREIDPDSALPFSAKERRTRAEPPATLTRLSEEHGVIENDEDLGWQPGVRVEILPNHACSVVNLARVICVTEGQGEERRVTAVWPVAARARVQ